MSSPWFCPACYTPINLPINDPEPAPTRIYRCSVCRLELVLDPRRRQMVVPAMETAADRPPKKKKRR